MMKRLLMPTVSLVLFLSLAVIIGPAAMGKENPKDNIPPRNKHEDPIKLQGKNDFCIECHRQDTPVIFSEWVKSTHARAGVGCAGCHEQDSPGEETFLHAGKFNITANISPLRCAKCHKDQYLDYKLSGHALARDLLTEMKEDDPRYPVVEQYKAGGFADCSGCHGSAVQFDQGHRPDPATWPNQGAGRLNQYGTHGACSSCHLGHGFSVAAARKPETCIRCHDGANYPEGGIYRQSVHGVLYAVQGDPEALGKPGLYFDGTDMGSPTCAFCHFNGSGHGLLTRHNGAWRVSRDLTSPEAPLAPRAENLRRNMKSVCTQCHASRVVDGFFAAADARLATYQEDYVKPKLAEYLKKLDSAAGDERTALLKEYSGFLAETKRYRLGLYMGGFGRTQR